MSLRKRQIHMRRTCVVTRTLLLITCANLGCSDDYTVPLPNGYVVARVYSGGFGIVNPQNHGVTPLSTSEIAVAVVGDIVAGEVDPSNYRTRTESTGYFVINTRTDEIQTNLSWNQFRGVLQANGVGTPPPLSRVNRFSKFVPS